MYMNDHDNPENTMDDLYIESLIKLLALRDLETEEHTRRVTAVTLDLARIYGIPKKEREHMRRGALLHDIGKIGFPDSILKKKGALTKDEWTVVHKHPQHAYELLNSIPHLRFSLDIPYCHHEKWDGTGYPRRLQGEQIPLAARIFSVVDVWDALLSNRSYRPAWKQKKVDHYLLEQSGKHFDPQVVSTFLEYANSSQSFSAGFFSFHGYT